MAARIPYGKRAVTLEQTVNLPRLLQFSPGPEQEDFYQYVFEVLLYRLHLIHGSATSADLLDQIPPRFVLPQEGGPHPTSARLEHLLQEVLGTMLDHVYRTELAYYLAEPWPDAFSARPNPDHGPPAPD